MSEVSASVVVAASLAEVWDYYFEPRWLAGLGRRLRRGRLRDGYPDAGGTLVAGARPRPARGEVTERVLEHEPRRLHRIAFRDPESAGELRHDVRDRGRGDAGDPGRSSYRLQRARPVRRLTDRLFIRSQVRRSLERSLVAPQARGRGAGRRRVARAALPIVSGRSMGC